jgi:hypothetical protein
MDQQVAADKIRTMHGRFRIPTLLKRVDLLARRGDPKGRPQTWAHRIAAP